MYYAHMLKLKMHKKIVQCTYYAAEARLKLSGSLTLWELVVTVHGQSLNCPLQDRKTIG